MMTTIELLKNNFNGLGDVMVTILTSSAVDLRFAPRYDQTEDYKKLVFAASLLSTSYKRTN